jgi:hypothetical protein
VTDAAWVDANQAYLEGALGEIRRVLRGRAGMPVDTPAEQSPYEAGIPPALQHLCTVFGLTLFERDVLLLCAGTELDSSVAALCAAASGDPRREWHTFGLALGVFSGAHWSALSPSRPLRAWRLVNVDDRDGPTAGRLRLDERILHFLLGIACIDERLEGLVERVVPGERLPASQLVVAQRAAAVWQATPGDEALPVLQICGNDEHAAAAVAATACAASGIQLFALDARDIPGDAGERSEFVRLWRREAALGGSALLLRNHDDSTSEDAATLAGRLNAPLVVAAREPLSLRAGRGIRFDLRGPTRAEQRELWLEALGAKGSALNGQLNEILTQFDFGRGQIAAASLESASAPSLWDACRTVARPQLDDLAQRIVASAEWDDIVLPPAQKLALREISVHVRQRATVYYDWGFASKSGRGLGISALFAGASGTGKTMAAEVLGRELGLDLYRIDLSSVVSKYIGETEKNLRRVFDAAEEGGAILLFDEADALFGKRSEVKDSHDRYANIEVGYLLQRMEAYRGLAILTTNMKSALDGAFLRRIRFIVQFPFPDAGGRGDIWRRVWPAGVPLDGLDFKELARLNVAGGSIRNIALSAAFRAAEEGVPAGMPHLLAAARTEAAKLERPLTDAEVGGWA